MEHLLKEQIMCMKKMLMLVQDGKENISASSLIVILIIFYNFKYRKKNLYLIMILMWNQIFLIYILKNLLM